jgi:hypothetical protein
MTTGTKSPYFSNFFCSSGSRTNLILTPIFLPALLGSYFKLDEHACCFTTSGYIV